MEPMTRDQIAAARAELDRVDAAIRDAAERTKRELRAVLAQLEALYPTPAGDAAARRLLADVAGAPEVVAFRHAATGALLCPGCEERATPREEGRWDPLTRLTAPLDARCAGCRERL